jgi:hypothetical protein
LRSFLIIVFCINLFSGGLLFAELAKLPALIAHYNVHCKTDQQTTFALFLKLHYTDTEHARQTAAQHEQLPFQHQHQFASYKAFCNAEAPELPAFLMDTQAEADISSDNFYYSRILPPGYEGAVFQPPKV